MSDYKQEIVTLIKDSLSWDDMKVCRWLDLPNPLLGGCTPNEMLEKGRGEKLLKFVQAQLEENAP